jgi:hypothetical protein
MRRSLLLLAFLAALACSPGSFVLAGGGIGGTGLSQGPITGFGSIFVTGVEWDLSEAQITIGGAPASEADLRLGMIVTVEGEFDESGLGGSAVSVVFDADITGPIAAIVPDVADPDVARLSVLDQTVVVENGVTDFEDTTFATLMLNDVIEVSGFADGAEIRATRVEWKGTFPGVDQVELEGLVENLSGNTFMIGSVEITWDAGDLSGFSSGVPGGFVEVEGTLTGQAPDRIQASHIEPVGSLPEDADDAEIEGIVSDFTPGNLASFKVAGQRVDARGAEFEGGSASDLDNGVRVEVEGEIAGGVFFADEVQLRGDEARIRAEVAADGDVDPAGGTLVLLGIPGIEVRTDASTRFEDDLGVPGFGLSDIGAGDFLEVQGLPVDTRVVLAERIKREGAADDVELRGRVDEIDDVGPERSVTILGVIVPTDDQTEFDEAGNEDEFYLLVMLGDLLEVTDDQGDGDETRIDIADQVEFEEDD